MKIGTLKSQQINNRHEWHGRIQTLDVAINIKLVPNAQKRSDGAPDFAIYAQSANGQSIEIGAGWKKGRIREDGEVFEFISLTLDDPSLSKPLNVAAFKNETGEWDITFRRRHNSKPQAA
jgi:uncharacterized protein (DUF736 family)